MAVLRVLDSELVSQAEFRERRAAMPAAAAAAQVAIDSVVQGLQLASDLKYREMAIDLKTRLVAATSDGDKKQLQDRLDAALKNISTTALKPT